ncbi:MAG: hypothetical protein RR860_15565, partial [Janthinobacterium sp.]
MKSSRKRTGRCRQAAAGGLGRIEPGIAAADAPQQAVEQHAVAVGEDLAQQARAGGHQQGQHAARQQGQQGGRQHLLRPDKGAHHGHQLDVAGTQRA